MFTFIPLSFLCLYSTRIHTFFCTYSSLHCWYTVHLVFKSLSIHSLAHFVHVCILYCTSLCSFFYMGLLCYYLTVSVETITIFFVFLWNNFRNDFASMWKTTMIFYLSKIYNLFIFLEISLFLNSMWSRLKISISDKLLRDVYAPRWVHYSPRCKLRNIFSFFLNKFNKTIRFFAECSKYTTKNP